MYKLRVYCYCSFFYVMFEDNTGRLVPVIQVQDFRGYN
jgi:hypothetical protein